MIHFHLRKKFEWFFCQLYRLIVFALQWKKEVSTQQGDHRGRYTPDAHRLRQAFR
jgi:hypothetical protein